MSDLMVQTDLPVLFQGEMEQTAYKTPLPFSHLQLIQLQCAFHITMNIMADRSMIYDIGHIN